MAATLLVFMAAKAAYWQPRSTGVGMCPASNRIDGVVGVLRGMDLVVYANSEERVVAAEQQSPSAMDAQTAEPLN